MQKLSFLVVCLVTAGQTYAADYSRADVCKATISVEMGRDSESMKVEKDGNMPVISYIRDDDLQQFIYRCKFNANQVVWAAYFDEEGDWGRWRDSADFGDAVTYFEVSGTKLLIKNDQSGTKTFSSSNF